MKKTYFITPFFIARRTAISCFYDEGLDFECNKCSACCRLSPGYVYLSQRDLTSLCQWFKLSQEEFIEKYCRWVGYYEGKEALALVELKNYDCIFWNKDSGCTAYGARPIQCSTYPFWSWILKDMDSWNSISKDCPGINKGKHWTKEQIDEQRSLYVHNEPITR
ncbi:YkgJ family cysteine cluster protein [Treponema sp.]|uniref:YkgJ family cysteine cluster protein n=1 Tax=Treponema sp. TaxID=166 RepID=UPI00298E16B0|nr:YkgJ family cysteine cluster protein [Treponema sp.]